MPSPGAPAAGAREARSVVARRLHVVDDTPMVLCRDQRAKLGARIERIADTHSAGALRHRLRHVVVEGSLHQQPRAGGAPLPVHGEDLRQRGIDHELRVRVVEDDDRRLAAELDRRALERRSAGRDHALAGARLTRERDQVDAR